LPNLVNVDNWWGRFYSKVIKDSGFADDVSFISTGGGAYVSKMEVLQKFLA